MIPKGATYREVVEILKREGVIQRGPPLLLLGRITGSDRRVMAGYYNLNTRMSVWDVFKILRDGRIIQYAVTIPPGSTLMDIKKNLETFGLIDDNSWGIVYDKRFLKSLNIDAPSLEGYIYPDTYNLPKGIKPDDIFSMMVQRMREMYDEPLRKRAQEMGMSERDVLTLASIIEKEAMHDSERPLISAVYHNRLKRGMRLQADPTVLYGIREGSRDIRYSDLKRHTPYNTYYIVGLPPGPIASPSIKSVRAALYPANVDYLFFVSRNDGTHHFSLTGEEHEQAVMVYQRNVDASNSEAKGFRR
ncbi:MAG: endolytic transglycosylase MltG [Thermodesulfovibrionia bacterium]